jgi:hypothetical protein
VSDASHRRVPGADWFTGTFGSVAGPAVGCTLTLVYALAMLQAVNALSNR